jgi:hypothetical protein
MYNLPLQSVLFQYLRKSSSRFMRALMKFRAAAKIKVNQFLILFFLLFDAINTSIKSERWYVDAVYLMFSCLKYKVQSIVKF